MTNDFRVIAYLQHGNAKQQSAFHVLQSLKVFDILAAHQPILTGTIPISIDIADSDLDIICTFGDAEAFKSLLMFHFANQKDFKIRQAVHQGHESVIAQFYKGEFAIEIFGQPIPTIAQYAYRHMLKEHEILLAWGEGFRQEVIRLKNTGLSTEQAFALLLGIEGDPYKGLLDFEFNEVG